MYKTSYAIKVAKGAYETALVLGNAIKTIERMFPEGYQAPPANPGNGDSGGGYDGSMPPDYPPLPDDDDIPEGYPDHPDGGNDDDMPDGYPDHPEGGYDDDMPEGYPDHPDGGNEGQPPPDGEPDGLLVRNRLGVPSIYGHPMVEGWLGVVRDRVWIGEYGHALA